MRCKISAMAVIVFWLMMATALAADVDGKWTSERQDATGETVTTTYVFKADGTNLTGTLDFRSAGNPNPISEGKIDGDNISFVVAITNPSGNEIKIRFKGKVTGDEMELTTEGAMGGRRGGPGSGEGEPFTIIAKRVK